MKRFLSILLGLLLVAGAIHAPAAAHDDADHVGSAHDVMLADPAHDEPEGTGSAALSGSESGSHTHLPSLLASGCDGALAASCSVKEVFVLSKNGALPSFSQAPPTEPPSA